MVEVSGYEPGTPSWVDLMSPDPREARDFYKELFGWGLVVPDETDGYGMFTVQGKDVAGLPGRPAAAGTPTGWMTYFACDDVDAVAERVGSNGGTVAHGPADVSDQGRVAIAADPSGIAFGLWQAGAHFGAKLVNEPGGVVWTELATPDLARARRFYTAALGYTWEPLDTGEGGPEYYMFRVAGRDVGGAMQADESQPHQWTTCFAVADTDATAATAERLGGGTLMPPTDSPYGRYAVLRDPQGAIFSIMRPPG